jgi:hypothetical protein
MHLREALINLAVTFFYERNRSIALELVVSLILSHGAILSAHTCTLIKLMN